MNKYDINQYYIDLCTAAPLFYAERIAEKYNFSHIFATPPVGIYDWKENIGAEKLVAIEACYGKSAVIECVITDHYDDLALLIRANSRILVRPSRKTREKVTGLFEFKII